MFSPAIVASRYRLEYKIGAGSFGQIYYAEDMESGFPVAIKTESVDCTVPQLTYESKLYSYMSGSTNVPRIYWFGVQGGKNHMVIDLLDSSLEDYFREYNCRFSLKTVLMLVDQMISCVEFLHKKNFIHRDIKPDNFVMGRGFDSNKIYIIDFGLAKKYRNTSTHAHIPYCEGKSLTGTARYASVNSLRGCEQSRRDDMESLGYVWVYLLKGRLPWMGLDTRDKNHRYDRIAECKAKTSIEDLCTGLPDEFVEYLEQVRSLKFTEEPNYTGYKEMFKRLFRRLGYVYDYEYDWCYPPGYMTSNLSGNVGPPPARRPRNHRPPMMESYARNGSQGISNAAVVLASRAKRLSSVGRLGSENDFSSRQNLESARFEFDGPGSKRLSENLYASQNVYQMLGTGELRVTLTPKFDKRKRNSLVDNFRNSRMRTVSPKRTIVPSRLPEWMIRRDPAPA